MQQRELKVEQRTKTGKGAARQLRAKDLVPGVVYGKGMESMPVSVSPKELISAVAGEGGRNNLITLKGAGLDGKVVIVTDILSDPLKGKPLHVDFHKIDMNAKIRVHVPLAITGTSVGVKEGGLLDVVMHSVSVECLPGQIPESIEVDITALTIGHSIHVGDIKTPAGVKVLEDSRASVVSVLGRAREEAPAEAAAT